MGHVYSMEGYNCIAEVASLGDSVNRDLVCIDDRGLARHMFLIINRHLRGRSIVSSYSISNCASVDLEA